VNKNVKNVNPCYHWDTAVFDPEQMSKKSCNFALDSSRNQDSFHLNPSCFI